MLKVNPLRWIFSPKASEALRKAYKDRPPAGEQFTFLAAVAKNERAIPEALNALAAEVEKLADKGVIRGHLAMPSSIVLADQRYGVFVFLVTDSAFDPKAHPELTQDLYVEEGSIGHREYDETGACRSAIRKLDGPTELERDVAALDDLAKELKNPAYPQPTTMTREDAKAWFEGALATGDLPEKRREAYAFALVALALPPPGRSSAMLEVTPAKVFTLRPGDIAVLEYDGDLSDDQIEKLKEHWRRYTNVPAVVLHAGMRLAGKKAGSEEESNESTKDDIPFFGG